MMDTAEQQSPGQILWHAISVFRIAGVRPSYEQTAELVDAIAEKYDTMPATIYAEYLAEEAKRGRGAAA